MVLLQSKNWVDVELELTTGSLEPIKADYEPNQMAV